MRIPIILKVCKKPQHQYFILHFKPPQNTRIVTSVNEDVDDEEFDDLEALRLAALQSLGSKVLVREHYILVIGKSCCVYVCVLFFNEVL